jgi:hypothetical protein
MRGERFGLALLTLTTLSIGACSKSIPPPLSTATSASTSTGGSTTAGTSTGTSTSSGSSTTTGTGTTTGGSATSSSSSSSTSGTTTAGTTGTPCVTAADCQSQMPTGQVCSDAGICAVPGPSFLGCIAVGTSCLAGVPCCEGPCDGGTCTPFSPCSDLGGSCGEDVLCCNGAACDAGSCVATCGGALAPCQQSSDCCLSDGLYCQKTGSGLRCLSSYPVGTCVPTAAPGKTQCDLGTPCMVGANGVDPCGPAGYVCDGFIDICRSPGYGEPCVPGGPSCEAIPLSTVQPQCVTVPLVGSYCLQPCGATGDCVDATTSCLPVSGQMGACLGDFCTNYFSGCAGSTPGDSTCLPFLLGSVTSGICFQGGDAGAFCSLYGNRENGGMCAEGQQCMGGICQAVCNSGSQGSPSCDAGSCLAIGSGGGAEIAGACTQSCDFTDPDGGGCGQLFGRPTRCYPDFSYGLLDDGKGFCVLESDSPLTVGESCTPGDGEIFDPCGTGLICGDVSGTVACTRMCKDIGHQGNCPAGQMCYRAKVGGSFATTTGFCN